MNMQVVKNTVVTLDYSVTDPDGELVDAGQEPLVYLHGGYDDIFPMNLPVHLFHKHKQKTDQKQSARYPDHMISKPDREISSNTSPESEK